MHHWTRRFTLAALTAGLASLAARVFAAASDMHQPFIAAAFQMKAEAVRAGDQPFGAVVVRDGRIVGFGPSRVVTSNDSTAHAEREAIRDARARLGSDLSGCVLFSTSRPCAICEQVAGEANIARMYFGAEATDAGPPVRRIFEPTR